MIDQLCIHRYLHVRKGLWATVISATSEEIMTDVTKLGG